MFFSSHHPVDPMAKPVADSFLLLLLTPNLLIFSCLLKSCTGFALVLLKRFLSLPSPLELAATIVPLLTNYPDCLLYKLTVCLDANVIANHRGRKLLANAEIRTLQCAC